MAMSDYFYTCYKLEKKTVEDGLGGYETVEYVGVAFMGLCVKLSTTEQLVGALRGNEELTFNFHTYATMPLEKDDRIMYYEGGVAKYIRLTDSAHINPELSGQTAWKSYSAASYIPAKLVDS